MDDYYRYLINSECYTNLDTGKKKIEELTAYISKLMDVFANSSGEGIDEFKDSLKKFDNTLSEFGNVIGNNMERLEKNANKGDKVLDSWRTKADRNDLYTNEYNYYTKDGAKCLGTTLISPISTKKYVEVENDDDTNSHYELYNGNNPGMLIHHYTSTYYVKKGAVKVVSAKRSENNGYIEVGLNEILTEHSYETNGNENVAAAIIAKKVSAQKTETIKLDPEYYNFDGVGFSNFETVNMN